MDTITQKVWAIHFTLEFTFVKYSPWKPAFEDCLSHWGIMSFLSIINYQKRGNILLFDVCTEWKAVMSSDEWEEIPQPLEMAVLCTTMPFGVPLTLIHLHYVHYHSYSYCSLPIFCQTIILQVQKCYRIPKPYLKVHLQAQCWAADETENSGRV